MGRGNNANVIREGAEHHFLTFIDNTKNNPHNWVCLHLEISKTLSHSVLVNDYRNIPAHIEKAKNKNNTLCEGLLEQANQIQDCIIYQFADQDIMILAQGKNKEEQQQISALQQKAIEKLNPDLCKKIMVAKHIYDLQKLADQKLLSLSRFEAYAHMHDEHKVSSINIRRKRRESPVVMFVEDDRFTAAYASNILNKEYDMVVCKNGEDAISDYIEHAPDIVFLDIHLPGLSGHETLQAIRAIDRNAYVVMLSVDTKHSNIIKASENGAHKFLKKPFSRERLIETVRASPYVRATLQSMQTH